MLDEFAACFSDKPGLCDVVTHRIVMTPAIVCVAKKSGGVRSAGNFRYWNILAVGDAHSTSKVKETLSEIAIRLSVSPRVT